MIGRLRGTLVELAPDRAVIDVAGVGYDVSISLQTFYAVSGRREREIELIVHTHVREDALVLYGFHDADERELFRALIGISGVGPRVALAILSGMPAAELRTVVAEGDRGRLQKVPGIGKKTAERVLLELGDRMRRLAGAVAAEPPGAPTTNSDGTEGTMRTDAISALVNLGYPEDRARAAVDDTIKASSDGSGAEDAGGELERVLRESLRRLAR